MDDLISRQAAIDAITEIDDGFNCDIYTNEVREILRELPAAQQTLFGYKIEHLAYIARVMEKEGVTAEYAVRTFDDMRRVVRMLLEEAQQKAEEMLYEQFNQQTGGNRCDTATSGRRIG